MAKTKRIKRKMKGGSTKKKMSKMNKRSRRSKRVMRGGDVKNWGIIVGALSLLLILGGGGAWKIRHREKQPLYVEAIKDWTPIVNEWKDGDLSFNIGDHIVVSTGDEDTRHWTGSPSIPPMVGRWRGYLLSDEWEGTVEGTVEGTMEGTVEGTVDSRLVGSFPSDSVKFISNPKTEG